MLICYAFPHYTWGYISFVVACCRLLSVPSLYVRVYLLQIYWALFLRGSLTIREGISSYNSFFMFFSLFPHYTWGYIALLDVKRLLWDVPSLYVRVYHPGHTLTHCRRGSLTIREGISPSVPFSSQQLLFPHYTWGYIELICRRVEYVMVPSLYVRVYRPGI